jgi:DNA-binding NtrC family response regulator
METQQQTILVVEDELPHLNLLRTIFEAEGYRVFAAVDGIEAKDVYTLHQNEINVVLCDVALPELGGWTVYQTLKEINPEVRVVLTSGYLDAKVKSLFVSGGVIDFIAKPYEAETILQTIKQALSS